MRAQLIVEVGVNANELLENRVPLRRAGCRCRCRECECRDMARSGPRRCARTRCRLVRVAVLHGVGNQVHQHELDAAGVGHHVRQVVRDLDVHAAGARPCPRAGGRRHARRPRDRPPAGSACCSAPRTQLRQPLERGRDLAEPRRRCVRGCRSAGRLPADRRRRQHPRQHLQDAERLPNLVAHQPAEVAQPRRLHLDLRHVTGDESVDGLLLQHADGALRTAERQHRRCRISRGAERLASRTKNASRISQRI